MESQTRGLIKAVMVGNEARIRQAAAESGAGLGNTETVPVETPEDAARVAVELAVAGKVGGLM